MNWIKNLETLKTMVDIGKAGKTLVESPTAPAEVVLVSVIGRKICEKIVIGGIILVLI